MSPQSNKRDVFVTPSQLAENQVASKHQKDGGRPKDAYAKTGSKMHVKRQKKEQARSESMP